jgi:hypothetical protein
VLPIPLEGYWVDRFSYEYAGTVYSCPRDTCKGGDSSTSGSTRSSSGSKSTKKAQRLATSHNDNNDDSNSFSYECWTYGNYTNDHCGADSLLCKEGSLGPLCGACREKYTYNVVINGCEKCKHSAENILLYIGITIVNLFVLALVVYMVIKESPQNYRIRNNSLVKLLANVDSGSLKVIWVTYQIIVSSSLSLNIKV